MWKQEQRLSLRSLLTNRNLWLLSIQSKFLIDPGRRPAQRAHLDPLRRVDLGAQFFGGEIKFIRRQPKIVRGIGFGITFFQSLKSSCEIILNRDRLIDYEHRVLQIIEDAGAACTNYGDEPFPTGKAFTFFRKDRAVTQRTRKAPIPPTLASSHRPFTKVPSRNDEFAHRRDLNLC